MILSIQIKTIVFSLVYGFFFSFFVGLNYRYMISRKLFGFIFSFLFILVFVFLYFIFLKKVNYGVFHYFEILFIFLGYFIETLLVGKVEKKLKK